MSALLLSLLLALQGIPLQAQQSGTITGVLKDSSGKPVQGIRMAAVAKVDPNLVTAAAGAAMSSIAETDEQGRYKLENVPPGHYYIAAGRLDRQTYYPGTLIMDSAKEVLVTPGLTVDSINFALNGTSTGRADAASGAFLATPASIASIPLQITIENRRKMPISSNGAPTAVRVDIVPGGNPLQPLGSAPLYETSVDVYGPQPGEYSVRVENLPETYALKSVKYGSTDITSKTFKLTAANFAPSSVVMRIVGALTPGVNGALAPVVFTSLVTNATPTAPPATPPSTLTIVIGEATPQKTSGVKVSGRLHPNFTLDDLSRLPYINGIPGTMFDDGTFEFRNVAQGRHTVFALGNTNTMKPLGGLVVIADRDVDGLTLEPIPFLPANARTPRLPDPASSLQPGQTPLPHIRGTIFNSETNEPITDGSITISLNGRLSTPYSPDSNGKFEIPMIASGTYKLVISIFGHSNVQEEVTISDKDVTLTFPVRKLY